MQKIVTYVKSFFGTIKQEWLSIPVAVKWVFLIYFLQGIIHNLGHPVTPKMVEDMLITEKFFGYYFAAMSFGMLLGGPIWGVLGDRGNKRTYIVIGLLIYSLGQFMFAYVGDKYWMILFRFISGFGVSASITLLVSHLIEHSSEGKRTIYLGWYQGLFVLGSSIGYYLGGLIPEITSLFPSWTTFDLRWVFILQALLNVGHAAYIFWLVKPSQGSLPHAERTNIFQGFKDVRHMNKNLIIFLISLALISFGAINISK